jgi:uncharacterized protein YlxP (DUF503 family)
VRDSNVYVGVYQARLEMPWVGSLKEKRALVKPVVERLKVRFAVSAARLSGADEHAWETIGVTAISSDRAGLERLLRKVEGFVAAQGDYRVTASSLDIELWEPLA